MPPLIHARLSASSSERWMHCTGSVRLSKGQPDVETDYQIEGRAAHALAEYAMTHQGDEWPKTVRVETEKGEVDFPVDDEMREHIREFGRLVWASRTPTTRMLLEQTVDLALLNPPEPMFGTADVVLIDGRALHVIDLKYGVGVVVNCHNNPQLMYYVLGTVLQEVTRRSMLLSDPFVVEDGESILDAGLRLFDEIKVTIFQPRAAHSDGPVRTTTIELDGLRAFATELMARARETQRPDAPLTPGTYCRFCPAQGVCPALRAHAQVVAQMDFDAVPIDTPPDPKVIPLAVVADMLTQVPVLESWIRAMYERVTLALSRGETVPGWKLVKRRAHRRWVDEAEVLQWAKAAGLKPTEWQTRALKSPAQMELLLGKKNVPDALYVSESSGLTLVPESDSRPAVEAVGPGEEFLALPPGPSTEENAHE